MDVNMFLVTVDYVKRTTEVLHFTDIHVALDAYVEHKHATADQPRVEVVLISVANEDVLRAGYSHMSMPPGLPRTSEGWVQFMANEEWRDYLSNTSRPDRGPRFPPPYIRGLGGTPQPCASSTRMSEGHRCHAGEQAGPTAKSSSPPPRLGHPPRLTTRLPRRPCRGRSVTPIREGRQSAMVAGATPLRTVVCNAAMISVNPVNIHYWTLQQTLRL